MLAKNFFDLQRFTETITLTEDNDKYNVSYGNSDKILYGLGGDDSISVAAGVTSVTIDCGSGDDEIWSNLGTGISIFGGDGDDYITAGGAGRSTRAVVDNPKLDELDDNTVRGGAGNDRIYPTFPTVIQFASGDGNDTVGYGAGQSTLQVDGDYYTLASGVDTIVYVGEDSILFQGTDIGGIENYGVAIVGGNQISPTNSETENTETTTAESTTNILEKNNNAYTYTGGNRIISSYASEKINYSADFTGIGFNDTDFNINSSTGSLTIQNAHDKIIDVAVNDNTVAYAYMASGGGNLDGSGFSALEVIIGGNNSANTITAGSGGSSLWGGRGGFNLLYGGEGVDTFFFGKNDGSVYIGNSSSSDVINLYDISIDDITELDTGGRAIEMSFNTGAGFKMLSSEDLSATFQLADGSRWKLNHSTNNWQSA